jgi:hypothetical protein
MRGFETPTMHSLYILAPLLAATTLAAPVYLQERTIDPTLSNYVKIIKALTKDGSRKIGNLRYYQTRPKTVYPKKGDGLARSDPVLVNDFYVTGKFYVGRPPTKVGPGGDSDLDPSKILSGSPIQTANSKVIDNLDLSTILPSGVIDPNKILPDTLESLTKVLPGIPIKTTDPKVIDNLDLSTILPGIFDPKDSVVIDPNKILPDTLDSLTKILPDTLDSLTKILPDTLASLTKIIPGIPIKTTDPKVIDNLDLSTILPGIFDPKDSVVIDPNKIVPDILEGLTKILPGIPTKTANPKVIDDLSTILPDSGNVKLPGIVDSADNIVNDPSKILVKILPDSGNDLDLSKIPVTVPKTTDPDTSGLDLSKIPVTIPKTADPDVSDLDLSKIPVTVPKTTDPDTSDLDLSKIPVTIPKTTDPDVSDLDLSKIPVTIPKTADPDVSDLDLSKIPVTVPKTTVPDTSDLDLSKIPVTIPKTTDPDVSDLDLSKIPVTIPKTTVPDTSDLDLSKIPVTVPQTVDPDDISDLDLSNVGGLDDFRVIGKTLPGNHHLNVDTEGSIGVGLGI